MITQRVDKKDPVLGFTHDWIDRLASKLDKLYVIASFIGEAYLPENVALFSLGKEAGAGRLSRIASFNKTMLKLIYSHKIDVIFVHMCPIYVIASAPFAKLRNIPIVMWYAHGSVGNTLRAAHIVSDRVVSSSKSGFRLKSHKLFIIGQGIDTQLFKPSFAVSEGERIVLSVGRISPVKDYETLLKAAYILEEKMKTPSLRFQIIGGALCRKDKKYLGKLKNAVRAYDLGSYIDFIGPVSHDRIVSYYQNCSIFVSASRTGSLDKSVLEAMACARPVLTSNEAFKDTLSAYRGSALFERRNYRELAQKISDILDMDEDKKMELGLSLRKEILANHCLDSLINNLAVIFEKLT